MKKQNVLILVIALIGIGFTSCSQSDSAKKVSLKSQQDSLNYYLGYLNGHSAREQYLKEDSSKEAIDSFINKLDDAVKQKDELEKMGIQFGQFLKEMETKGLRGDSTIKLNKKLIEQGMVNGLKGFKEGMTAQEAGQYFQKTMTAIEQAKRPKMAQPAPLNLQDSNPDKDGAPAPAPKSAK